MTNLRPQECVCSSEGDVGRDRLSEMPDEVLVNILSFMETLDAVSTVLLRRFGNLWTLIHNLEFDTYYVREGKAWIRRFVRNVLMLHQKPSIDSFVLYVDFDNENEDEIDEAANEIKIWFRFALEKQAKEITLSNLSTLNKRFCTSFLPKLTSQFLVTLDLAYCKIDREVQVKLGSLKKLSLTYVYLDDEIFQSFISGCPSLQELVIGYPFGMTDLSFSSPNIDKLSLVFDVEFHGEHSLALNTPNLRSLYLNIYMNGVDIIDTRGVHIVDVSSVRDIYIVCNLPSMSADKAIPFTTKLLEKIEGVEVFRLSLYFSKIFLRVIQNLQLNRWKRIVLELDDFRESYLLGIYHLMRSLKHFEELIIYTTEDFKASTDLQQVELSPPYVPPQLKTITLHGYGKTWKSQLLLIESLLKSAAVLDKFVIIPMKHQLKEADELEFVKQVSSLPKASSSARVIFA
ncbi:F-box/FBD/LRR-repeat protein At3g26920-like [Silene latifolia]|uniref:F-box/FBD/LRR-repeat protein At3g26920-like n=1 Tax=Silene latifolia TaxID=37657 RepID=UPI003D772F8D